MTPGPACSRVASTDTIQCKHHTGGNPWRADERSGAADVDAGTDAAPDGRRERGKGVFTTLSPSGWLLPFSIMRNDDTAGQSQMSSE